MTALQFQLLGSSAGDVKGEYQITLFGSTAEGNSVGLTVTGFEPFFYVEIPDTWTARQKADYRTFLTGRFNKREQTEITITTEKHKSFWDFNNNELLTFLKIQTQSKRLWTKVRDICQDKETCLPIPYKDQILRVFEANIDPMLRFYHLRELKPAGWVSVSEDDYDDSDEMNTTTAYRVSANWAAVAPAAPDIQLTSAPLRVMSWDIECTSSHGDFPLAIKTWRKPAREAVELGLSAAALCEAIQAAVKGQKSQLSRVYIDGKIREVELGLPDVAAEWPSINLSSEDAIDRAEALLGRCCRNPKVTPLSKSALFSMSTARPYARISSSSVPVARLLVPILCPVLPRSLSLPSGVGLSKR
jgi:hypothetical protein